MLTRLYTRNDIKQAACELLRGNIIAFATETVYGLAAPVFNFAAIEKIFIVKGRPSDNPLIIHISRLNQLSQVAVHIPPLAYTLARAFWPGPLTLILARHPHVPGIVTGGLNTVAVRMPAHPDALALIDTVGQPLVAPSANISGKPSSTRAEHVLEDFNGKIAGVLDGGICPQGIESTVIDITAPTPLILRPGPITKDNIEKVIGQPVIYNQINEHTSGALKSPGMKYRHYAPEAKIIVLENKDHLNQVLSTTEKPLMILSNEFATAEKNIHVYPLNPKTLYHYFRQSDKNNISTIIIIHDAVSRLDTALVNRINKAAQKQ